MVVRGGFGAAVVGFGALVVFVAPPAGGAVVVVVVVAGPPLPGGIVPAGAGPPDGGGTEPLGAGPVAPAACGFSGRSVGLLKPALAPTSRTVPAAVPIRAIIARLTRDQLSGTGARL
ncbi:hypothetical protein GCM10010532_059530 [Dactylosporangium siamense]|uniref:Uncharacterized protein n=1 Tax=Dactylosporangium siamense TaxID=685454 RepID=A0A919U8U7_9ACTN|nr:hypothetical protein Dsi01nite_041480 [Dactylosporangium siamense]